MLVTVYDKEGNAHEKESADARECVTEMGWTMDKIEKPVKDNQQKKGQQ